MKIKIVEKLPFCVVCWINEACYETKTVLVDMETYVCKACANEVCTPEMLKNGKELKLKGEVMKEELEKKLAEAQELFTAKKYGDALAIIEEGQKKILTVLEQDPRNTEMKSLLLKHQKLGARTRVCIHMAGEGRNTDNI